MKLSRPPYRTADGGTARLSAWYVSFADHLDRRHRLRAFTDKSASEDFGRTIEKLVGLRATRQGPDAAMVAWLENLSDYHRAKLSEWGLVDRRLSTLSDELFSRVDGKLTPGEAVSAFRAALLAKGTTPMHADLRQVHVLTVLDRCGFTYWRDLDAAKVESWLAEERGKGMKQRTSNHYATAIKSFAAWMVRSGRAGTSPLASIRKVTVADAVRAGVFTPEQVRTLLAHCNQATDTWGANQRKPDPAIVGPEAAESLTGPERAIVYRFACETGLRANAIRTLTAGQIRFERDERGNVIAGTVRTSVGQQKNRHGHDVPLRRGFASELAQALAGKATAVRAFRGFPAYAAAMLRNDLFNAGLPLMDEDGLPLKFHSFRATCATWLGEAGLSATDIASVTGHLTRSMLDHYTHATRRAGRRAVETLPELPSLRATGTESHDAGMRRTGPRVYPTGPRAPRSRYHEGRTGARAAEWAGLENQ